MFSPATDKVKNVCLGCTVMYFNNHYSSSHAQVLTVYDSGAVAMLSVSLLILLIRPYWQSLP